MTTEIITYILGLFGFTSITAFLSWLLKKAIADLQRQVTPNGGSSMYDKVSQATEMSRKALEMSVMVDAQLREVKTKVDAIILSGIPKG